MQRVDHRWVRHAFEFQAGFAEIEQQAELQASCLEIIHALGTMRFIQCPHSIRLDQQHFLDQQVYKVLTNDRAIIGNCDHALLHDCEASLARKQSE